MNLDAALSVANSGLANVQAQFGVISHNVANAGTPAYATEIGTQQSLDASGQGLGVRTGPATRQVDAALQQSLTAQNGTVAGLTINGDTAHPLFMRVDDKTKQIGFSPVELYVGP